MINAFTACTFVMRARKIYRKLTGKRRSTGLCELSTPRIHEAVLRAIEGAVETLSGDHLDIGSGGGQLLRLVAARYERYRRLGIYAARAVEPAPQRGA